MSEGRRSEFPFTPLTQLSGGNDQRCIPGTDLFLNRNKSLLDAANPATLATATLNSSQTAVVFLSTIAGTAGSTPPVLFDYVLFRKLHFANSISVFTESAQPIALSAENKKLIILVHGWNPNSNPYSYIGEFEDLISALFFQIENTDWRLVLYRWEADADTGPVASLDVAVNGTEAAEVGYQHGRHLGELLARTLPDIEQVHFIAHSAGSWVARTAAKYLIAHSKAVLQVTLLDPFIPGAVNSIAPGSVGSLNRQHMDQMTQFAGSGILWQAENYFSNDGPAIAGTQEIFNWEERGVNEKVGVGEPADLIPFTGYWGHAGPISFFADTVLVADGKPALSPQKIAKFDISLLGWRRSMFQREPIFTSPTGPQTPFLRSVGEDVTLNAEAVTRADGDTITLRWYKDGQPLTDQAGHVSGAINSSTLTLHNTTSADSGEFKLRATTYGLLSNDSPPITLTIGPSFAGSLEFPLPNLTPYDRRMINSVFDHSIGGREVEEIPGALENSDKDGVVVAYTGERGDVEANDDCYRQSSHLKFRLQGNYRSALGDETYLCYDGHAGYDYKPVDAQGNVLSHVNVRAAASGRVIFAGWENPQNPSAGFGQYVKIDHENGYFTLYGHLNSILVTSGSRIDAAQVIGTTGNTGASTGEHLHFQVRRGDDPGTRVSVDPYGWKGRDILWKLPATVSSDNYEPNASFEAAHGPLAPGSRYEGKISSLEDMDYFKIHVTAPGRVSLALEVPSDKDYELTLYNASRVKVKESVNDVGRNESVEFDAPGASTYYVVIYGFAGAFSATSSYVLSGTWPASASQPNRTPTLAEIGDRTIGEGQTLRFNAQASDPDTGQTLRYSLDAGSPSGASIVASTGLFTWTPNSDQGGQSYKITVRVTDNGSPFLNAKRTFRVTVRDVPAGLPDLTAPSGISVSPDPVNEGDILTWRVRVQNDGSAAAGPSRARAFLSPNDDFDISDDVSFGTPINLPSLAPGESVEVSFSGIVPSFGSGTRSVWLVIELDDLQAVEESDENNYWKRTNPVTVRASLGYSFRLLAGTGSDGPNPFSLVELQTNPLREVQVSPNTRFLTSLDSAPDGWLFGASLDSLYVVNLVSGNVVEVGTIRTADGSTIWVHGIAFSPDGALYATGRPFDDLLAANALYTIDTTNAAARRIGEIGDIVWGIDFAPDGRLYGAFGSLFLLDRNTGRIISRIGPMPEVVDDIDFADDGSIYGVHYETKGLYRINPNTADTATVGIYESELWSIASVATSTVAPVVSNSRGDFDGDGKPDLIFQNADGFLAGWFMNGPNLSSASFLQPNKVGDPNYRVAATGDFNNDGKEDLVFQHADGTIAVWFMNGTSLTDARLLDPSNPGDRDWRVVGSADLNGDGKPDLVLQYADGSLAAWYLNGIKLNSSAFFNPSNPGDARWKAVGLGDFNSDGRPDLVFQHDDGTLAVWFLSGASLIGAELISPSNPGAGWSVVSVADRNQDAKPDILFQHSNLDLAVWFMNGTSLNSGVFVIPRNSGGTWSVVGPK